MFNVRHQRLPARHLFGDHPHLRPEPPEDVPRLVAGAAALLGERTHLFGNDGKSASLCTGTGRFDRGVEREEIRLIGNLRNDFNKIGNALRTGHQRRHLVGAFTHEALRSDQPFDCRSDLFAIRGCDVGGTATGRRGVAGVIDNAAGGFE